MRLDLLIPEVWEDLNDSVAAQLDLPEKTSAKCYQGLVHAVFEICEGASNFFSHKRSLGIIKGQTPIFGALLPGLYKDGYQVQVQQGWPTGTEKTWVESLKKDTNFVLFASDNPASGETFQWDELDSLLNEKKIFSVRVSHADWLRDFKNGKKSVRPYSVHILSVGPGLAIAICGEKVKSPSVISAQMHWSTVDVPTQIKKIMGSFIEDEMAVTEFEKKMQSGWKNFLPVGTPRLFDRSLIYHPEVHGEALIQELSKIIQKPVLAAGDVQLFETTNLGRWHSTLNYFDWWEATLTPEIIRGMIVIDASILKSDPEFSKTLNQAMKNLAL